MLESNDIEAIKVLVVGDGSTGKTCLLRRFVRGDFVNQYKKTIGAEYLEKDVFLRDSGTTVRLMLWDTAGQEIFNALTQAYYRGAGAAIIAFSTVDRDSFLNAESWKKRVEAVCGPITIVLCQLKLDQTHEAAITVDEAERLSERLKVPLFRVSSKDDFNITQLFEFTTQRCLQADSPAPSSSPTPAEVRVPATTASALPVVTEPTQASSMPAPSPAVLSSTPQQPLASPQTAPTGYNPHGETPSMGTATSKKSSSPGRLTLRADGRENVKKKRNTKCVLL